MKTKRISILPGITLLCILLPGCGSIDGCFRDQRLRDQVSSLHEKRDSLTSELSTDQRQLEALGTRLNAQQGELSDYQAQVATYMLNHKMAVAALVVGVGSMKISLDESSEISQDAKDIAGPVAVMAGIWALANFDEVTQVLGNLNEADTHVRTLKSAIQSTQSSIESQQGRVQADRQNMAAIDQQIGEIQKELGE